ncbi:HAD hydrolase-like protein [Acetobacter sp. AN02]|uniref:HAD hydrolase-like protein n=1 Tax=Acetobacter sp. AN02 TaxID=2894186 RepID=UPI00243434F7|nr:HAD hydrolase-like protein [Acetobacter sp. AN02]MDG6093957.1 HAD hydrolase-like protein [Acetobacter sp. AN02]
MTFISTPSRRPAVLFDLDGTIINSREGIIHSIHNVLRDMGHEPDLSMDLTWVVGPPLPALLREILHQYGDDRADLAVTLYRKHYEHGDGMKRTPVFEGMREAIAAIRHSGTRMFIATSKPVHLAKAILKQNGLLENFQDVYGARPDDSGAEKPELIASLMREQDVSADQAVMLGDRRFDISGAHANRMRAVGVLWGYGGLKELTEAGAEAIAGSPSDLPDMVRQQFAAAAVHI